MSSLQAHSRASWPDGWIDPVCNFPSRVRAIMTTRAGGVSLAPFDGCNLGSRCGDDPGSVARNRAQLRSGLPAEPVWLKQVHGTNVVDAALVAPQAGANAVCEPEADASFSRTAGVVCGVLVADCMPILLADHGGQCVAAAHAGWRGMSGGVIEATISAMGIPAAEIVAWLGPAIGPRQFEVGNDVRQAFMRGDPEAGRAFHPYPGRDGKFLCDLVMLARQRLTRLGVLCIGGGEFCTVSDPRFYSYRRDRTTGRMGAFIWIESGAS